MQDEGVVVSAIVAAITMTIMFSVAPWSTGDRAQAVGETVVGLASKPVGTALSINDAARVAGSHSCNAYLLDLAMDAFL